MAIDFKSLYFLVDYDIRKGDISEENMWIAQGDTSRGISVSLYDRDKMIEPHPSTVLRLSMLKPDGKRVWLNSELIEGAYWFHFTSQVSSTVGTAFCEIELIYGGKTKRSRTFDIIIKASPSYGAVESYEIDIDTIKKGTLVDIPENLTKGEVWADVTENPAHPTLRIKL